MASRALLIGIGETSWGNGRFPPLPEVAQDVDRVRRFLAARGFSISVETDRHRASVAMQLERHVDATQDGDQLVIYFSGHGYQVADTSGDEIDHQDEALICADLPILDDWFFELWRRARPGARFITVVDACHADSMTLGMHPENRAPIPIIEKSSRSAKAPYRLILSACRDEETTLELARNDAGGGVVTNTMLEVLAGTPLVTYRDLWSTVAQLVVDRYYSSGVGVPTPTYIAPDSSLLETPAFSV